MTLYQRYARLPIRFAELGLERGSEKSSYFCTPKGARVIGWAGVDGIHFCFVPGYGDMVFAVNPMAAGDYVQAVARSFEDFLRLVIACGGSAAIEQARYWTREQFNAFLQENDTDYPPRADVLRVLREKLGLTAMPDPYGYLETLRREFDASALQPREVPAAAEGNRAPFPVDWGGSIHGSRHRHKPARELAVNAAFHWGAEEWLVPNLYLCAEGVVVDYCIGVDVEKVTEFLRWYEALVRGDWGVELTDEQQEEAERRNPLQISFHSTLTVNGDALPAKSGSGTVWVPESCGSEELTQDNRRTRAILEHYGLSEDKAWVFWRGSYPWTRQRTAKSVSLHLSRDRQPMTAAYFTDPAVGDEVTFTHPVSGQDYTLRVACVEPQVLEKFRFHEAGAEYADHFTALTCLLEPPLQGVTIRDCAPNDPPRGGRSVCAVQIFGRRDTAAAVPEGQQEICAASSMHFEHPVSVTWRVVINERPMEDAEVKLI